MSDEEVTLMWQRLIAVENAVKAVGYADTACKLVMGDNEALNERVHTLEEARKKQIELNAQFLKPHAEPKKRWWGKSS